MLSLIINIILIAIGLLGFQIFGYFGTLFLITDIFLKYFDIQNIKILLLFEITFISIAGFVWDRSLVWIIAIDIFLFIGTLVLFQKINNKDKKDSNN